MPNHPTRKCACWAPVKLIAKYCLKHWEELRKLRAKLSMIRYNRESDIEKYTKLYNFLNKTNFIYWEWINEVKYTIRCVKKRAI